MDDTIMSFLALWLACGMGIGIFCFGIEFLDPKFKKQKIISTILCGPVFFVVVIVLGSVVNFLSSKESPLKNWYEKL